MSGELAAAYWSVKRPTSDGSISEAIRKHSQACGLVAFVFDTHPDRVAEAVRDAEIRGEKRNALLAGRTIRDAIHLLTAISLGDVVDDAELHESSLNAYAALDELLAHADELEKAASRGAA